MDNLYDIIKNSTDVNGLPVMDKNQFLTLKEKYGKEEFRKVLLDYIKKEKPSFPLKEFSEQKVIFFRARSEPLTTNQSVKKMFLFVSPVL